MSDSEVSAFPLGPLTVAEGEMVSRATPKGDVMVCRVGGALFAIEDMCSHADTTLSDGLLMGHIVTCALHGAQFDVRDGAHTGPPAYCGVASYDVTEGPDGVTVTLRRSNDTPEAPPSQYFQTR
jgi:3-phenylpropionate/trans-cinnamate dioxygenase ferredoxin component